MPQPGRQHLLQLGQRPRRRLLEARHPAGRGPQSHRHGEGLVVVQQQRRQRRAGPQPVAAADAGDRLDRIAEAAQPVDVAAHRPGAHLQPRGQLGTGPVGLDLEQRQQPQQSGRRVQHMTHSARYRGSDSFRNEFIASNHEHLHRDPPVPDRHRPDRPRRPARPARPHPLAPAPGRRRLGPRRPAGLPAGPRRLLGRRLRLARPGGPAERDPAVRHHHRRPGHPLPARPLGRAGRPAADPDPRLAQLAGGVPRGDRTADRPPRARRRPGRRLRRGHPLAARVRVLHAGVRPRLGQPVPRSPRPGRS